MQYIHSYCEQEPVGFEHFKKFFHQSIPERTLQTK